MADKKKEEAQAEGLFPLLPEDLGPDSISDEDLAKLLDAHKASVELIDADDPTFIGDMPAEEVLAEYRKGVDQIKLIRAEQRSREEAAQTYVDEKAAMRAEMEAELPKEEPVEAVAKADDEGGEEEGDGDDSGDEDDGSGEEVVAEAEAVTAEAAEAPEPVAAAAAAPETNGKAQMGTAPRMPAKVYRRPPTPTVERQGGDGEPATGVPLVAASMVPGTMAGKHLDATGYAETVKEYLKRSGDRVQKHDKGIEEKVLLATASYRYPEEQQLYANDLDGNAEKIKAIGSPYLGPEAERALVASGGICAPPTPIYTVPDLSTRARPVRDALPSFQAERGGVSVPSVSYIGDITTAIDTIEEADDALGGTFATKSCQDQTCATWTEVFVGIISHCREFGNLNARTWPEGIAHENAITMSAHSRVAEGRLLDRIKTLSINVTGGAATLSAWTHLVYALLRQAASIRYVLRLEADTVRLQALMPAWLIDLLLVDQINDQFDRFMARERARAVLAGYGIDATFYLDTPSTGTTQAFAAETASAIDDFPDIAQIALYPAGTFLHIDGGVLELGLVRDSTLNSTNDFQLFGETFENVARIGPTQAARWLSVTICPQGTFPALGTAISC